MTEEILNTLTSALATRRHRAKRAATAVTESGGATAHATMVSVVTHRMAAIGDAEKSVESVDRSVGHLRRDRGTPIEVKDW